MKSYALELGDVPIAVFRAADDDCAQRIADGELVTELRDIYLHDGTPLWDRVAKPTFRPATIEEHQAWIQRIARVDIASPGVLDAAFLLPGAGRVYIRFEDCEPCWI